MYFQQSLTPVYHVIYAYGYLIGTHLVNNSGVPTVRYLYNSTSSLNAA